MVRKIVLSLVAVLAMSVAAFAQNVRVSGVVVDETNKPVVGATVFVEGSNVGVNSGLDGSFIIEAPKNAALNVSFIGYESQKIQLGAQTHYRIVMKEDALAIESVSVIGYGSVNKVGSITGSISKVDGDLLKNKPTVNVADALQGQVSGMQVFTSSGEPTETSSIRLHGVGSLTAGSTPLILLDGAPISASTMNMLNPNDIETVNILKDASATSVYGSRAANGVIYITTKRGQRDREATITFNAQYGISQPASDRYNMMNGHELVAYQNKYGVLDSVFGAGAGEYIASLGYDTNWREYFYDYEAPMYQVDMSVSGGSKKTSYYVSGMFMDQQGTDYASGVHKYSFRANVESQAKKWFKIGANSSIGYDERQLSQMTQGYGSYTNTSPAFAAILWPTWDTPYDPETGEEVWYNMSGYMNPKLRNQYYKYKGNTLQLNTTGFVQFTPIENLNIKAQVGVDLWDYTAEDKKLPSYPEGNGKGYVDRWANNDYTITYTNTIDYQRSFDEKHNIYALVGHESVMYKSQGLYGTISGQTSDNMLTWNNGTGTPSISDSFGEYAFNSVFARAEYNFDRKYNVDASVRFDESSRFGVNNRGAIFWSVGGKWNALREDFLKDVAWLSELSVRASYGTQGNASIGNYASLGLVGSATYGDASGLVINTTQNDDLGWETQKLFTAGFSAGFWKDRLTVDFEFYNRKTVDMLMEIPYPATSGYSDGTKNVGGMLNRGIDMTVRGDIVRTKDWLVSVYANFNYNKNQITELFNGYDEYALPDYGLCYKVGHDANEFYMQTRLGVDPEDGNIIWATVDPVTGERGETKNFSQATSELQGKSYIPPMVGGFGLNAQWKGLSVAADFSWVAKKYLINNDRIYSLMDAYSYFNRDRALLDRWEKPGDVSMFGKFGTEDSYFDTVVLEDASFLRLKNLTVGYELPRKWMAATGFLQGVRFYFTARNILTFTKYTGFDPEVDSNLSQPGNNYPNSRQFVGGIQLTF